MIMRGVKGHKKCCVCGERIEKGTGMNHFHRRIHYACKKKFDIYWWRYIKK